MAKNETVLHFNDAYNPITLLTTALLIAILLSTLMTIPVLADAPAEGIVVEGESVPGVALGDTRAQVEATYGEPGACQDVEVGGDLAWCRYPVEGGGSISVDYQGADGRFARNAPDDIAYRIRWPKAVSGWITTAGINTELAFDDRPAVVDAYPNAEVTYDEDGVITEVDDPQLGIRVQWFKPVYIFTEGSVSMEIYTPPAMLADGSSIHVAGIDLFSEKNKGVHHIIAVVSVLGEQGQPVSGANVVGTWTYPRGATQTVDEVTSHTGYAFFELGDARNGTWTLTIDDVLLDGHPLDTNNSVLGITFKTQQLK